MPGSEPYAVRAVLRVLDLLDLLGESPDGASLATLAARAQLPKTSAFRYLATLESRGYAERDPRTGHYRLGVGAMSFSVPTVDLLVRQAHRYLEELRDRFQESMNLAILDRSRVLYVEILESPLTMRHAARPGDRDHLHSTALGKAIASQLSDDRIREILEAEGMPMLTARTIADADAFVAAVEQVRARGVAVDDGENEAGAYCVAVPLAAMSPPAAISLSAPTLRVSGARSDEIARALRVAAREIVASVTSPTAARPAEDHDD